jgi:hypothetical protein
MKSFSLQWVFLFALLWAFSFAHSENVSYSTRPNILDIKAEKIEKEDAPDQWEKHREGLRNYVAQLLAFYPNEHIYFLARDAEYLYDTARVFLQDDKQASKRLHLINLSSNTVEGDFVKHYSEQNGLTSEALGKARAIMVDTGFSGSIPDAIRFSLPEAVQRKIQGHLIQSQSNDYPSSRVYLSLFNKNAKSSTKTDQFSDVVESLEGFPHYTESADEVKKIKGEWKVYSSKSSKAARDLSTSLIGDIRKFGEGTQEQARFRRILRNMKKLTEAAEGDRKLNRNEVSAAVDALESDGVYGFLHDLADAQKKGNVKSIPRSFSDFWETAQKVEKVPGMTLEDYHTQFEWRPGTLEHFYPELSKFLSDPATSIPKATSKELPKIIEAASIGQPDTNAHIIANLLPKKQFGQSFDLIKALAESGSSGPQLAAHLSQSDDWRGDNRLRQIKKLLVENNGLKEKEVEAFFAKNEASKTKPKEWEVPYAVKEGDQFTLSGESFTIKKLLHYGRGELRAVIEDSSGQEKLFESHYEGMNVPASFSSGGKNGLQEIFRVPKMSVYQNKHAIYTPLKGTRGDAWLKEWKKAGSPGSDPAVKAMARLFYRMNERSAFPKNILHPTDFLWDGKEWGFSDTRFETDSELDIDIKEQELETFWDEDFRKAVKKAKEKIDVFPELKEEEGVVNLAPKKLAGLRPGEGSTLKIPGTDLEVKVGERLGKTSDIVRYHVTDNNEEEAILAFARYDDKESNDYIRKLPGLLKELEELGIPVPDIKEIGEEFMLYEPIDSETGKKFLDKAKNGGEKTQAYRKGIDELMRVMDTLVDANVYVDGLLPKNMNWDGSKWTVTKVDSIQKSKKSKNSLLNSYIEYLAEEWGDTLSPDICKQALKRIQE